MKTSKEILRSRTRIRALLIGTLVATVPAGALAGLPPAQKCSLAKSTAALKKFAAKMKCHQKGIAKGSAVDAQCLTKAESKFAAAIMKAEEPGACLVNGDGDAIESLVDDCVTGIASYTPPIIPPDRAEQACAVAKSKAAVKKLAAKVKCFQRVFPDGVVPDPACLAAAEAKFNAAIAKAEEAGACTLSAGGPAIEDGVDACSSVLVSPLFALPTTTTTSTTLPPGVCCHFTEFTFDECTMTVDASACALRASGATVGPGVCTSNGTCGTSSPGNCCQISGSCVSSLLAPSGCTSSGGVFDASKACTTNGCQ